MLGEVLTSTEDLIGALQASLLLLFYKNPVWWIKLLPLPSWGNSGSENLSSLPQITHVALAQSGFKHRWVCKTPTVKHYVLKILKMLIWPKAVDTFCLKVSVATFNSHLCVFSSRKGTVFVRPQLAPHAWLLRCIRQAVCCHYIRWLSKTKVFSVFFQGNLSPVTT